MRLTARIRMIAALAAFIVCITIPALVPMTASACADATLIVPLA